MSTSRHGRTLGLQGPRTALVTGASTGLGAVVATYLAKQGYDLIITARHERPLARAARTMAADGGSVTAIPGDVKAAGHRQALQEAVHRRGRLDLLINNASALGPSPLPPLAEHPIEDLRGVLEVNLIAPISLVQHVLPYLEASGGLIVNITSDAAHGGYVGWGGYGGSKAALELASLTLANELRDRGIGVVAVDPGDLRTAMHQRAFPGEDISDRPKPEVTLPFWAWLLEQPPLAVSGQRLGAQSERWEIVHAGD
ncbi:MAG: SDR family NAD(P)-dependent oxidoreductase [Thermoplasmata archaeon]